MIQNNPFRRSVDGKRSKKGVSPVIGVILMVAATIVIAAVVIAMLGGFSAPRTQYLVTATASQNSIGDLVVTFQGGPDSSMVSGLNVTVVSANGSSIYYETDATRSTTWDTGGVGATAAFPKDSCGDLSQNPNDDHVSVAATFKDGSAQVILDTWV